MTAPPPRPDCDGEISLDIDAPVNSSLAFLPAEHLSFALLASSPIKAYQLLTIWNVHPTHTTFFSVKTLKPERYFIKPSKCMLGPREKVVVRIELRQALYDEVLVHFTMDHKLVTDRLLVQSGYNTNPQHDAVFANALRFKDEMKSKEKDAAWTAAWKTLPPSSIQSKNLIMRFEPAKTTLNQETRLSAPLLTAHGILQSQPSSTFSIKQLNTEHSTLRPLFTTQETTFSIDEGAIYADPSLLPSGVPMPEVIQQATTAAVSPAAATAPSRSMRKSSFSKREKSGLSLALAPSTETIVFSVSPHKETSYASIHIDNLSSTQRICYTVRIESKFRCKALPARVGWIDYSASKTVQLELAISLHQEILHLLSQGEDIEAYKVRLQVMELDEATFTTLSAVPSDAVNQFLKDLWQNTPKRMFVQKYVASFALDTTIPSTPADENGDEMLERNSEVSECASFATAFTRAPPMRPIMTPLEHLQYQRSLNSHLLSRNTVEEFRPTIFDDVAIEEGDGSEKSDTKSQPKQESAPTTPQQVSTPAVPVVTSSPREIEPQPTTAPVRTSVETLKVAKDEEKPVEKVVVEATRAISPPSKSPTPPRVSFATEPTVLPSTPPKAVSITPTIQAPEPTELPTPPPAIVAAPEPELIHTPAVVPAPSQEKEEKEEAPPVVSIARTSEEAAPREPSITVSDKPAEAPKAVLSTNETPVVEEPTQLVETPLEAEVTVQATQAPEEPSEVHELAQEIEPVVDDCEVPVDHSSPTVDEDEEDVITDIKEEEPSPEPTTQVDSASVHPRESLYEHVDSSLVDSLRSSKGKVELSHDASTTSSSRSLQSDTTSDPDSLFQTLRESTDNQYVSLALASTTNLDPIVETNEGTPHSSFIEANQYAPPPQPPAGPSTPPPLSPQVSMSMDDMYSGFSIVTYPQEDLPPKPDEDVPSFAQSPRASAIPERTERPAKARFSLLKAFERNLGSSSTPSGLVTITPQTLLYHMDVGTVPSGKVTLHNHTSGMVVYKIKSAQPQRYKVKPSQGFLEPLAQIQVEIGLHSAAYDELMCLSKLELDDVRDCLLVETVRVSNSRNANAIRGAGHDLLPMLKAMWSSVDKKQVNASRLFCEFSFDDSAYQSFASTVSAPVFSPPPPEAGPKTPPSGQASKIGFGWKRSGSNKVLRDKF